MPFAGFLPECGNSDFTSMLWFHKAWSVLGSDFSILEHCRLSFVQLVQPPQ